MSAATVNVQFQRFVNEMFNWSEQVFRQFTADQTIRFPVAPKTWTEHTQNAEARLQSLLYQTLSENIQTMVFGNKSASGTFVVEPDQTPTTIIIIVTMLNHINPGGAQVMQQLLKYLRNPDEAKDAVEAIAELGRWRRAQVSVTSTGLNAIPPFEYLEGLMRIVRTTADENEDLKFMVSSIKK